MQTTTTVPPPGVVASGAEVLDEMLRLSGRGYTVVRHILLELPDDAKDRHSVLGPMVTDRKRRSLQIYLLLLTVWPWLEKSDPLPNNVWARALETETGRRWSATDVSNAWRDLEDRGLIKRERLSRGVKVTPRREDGQAEYTQPGGKKNDHRESYFVLPPTFWQSGLFEKLSMPGLAMLLIIAGRTSEKAETWLTIKDAATWYGLSKGSVEEGLKDLKDKVKLLDERVEWIKAPLSKLGATKRFWYSLTGEYSTEERRLLQEKTRQETQARLAAKASPKASGTPKVAAKPKGADGDPQMSDQAAEGVTATSKPKRRRKEKKRT